LRGRNATILYATLAKGRNAPEHQLNSTRHFMARTQPARVDEHHRCGRWSFQNYPEDYSVIEELHKRRRDDAAHCLQPFHPETEAAELCRSCGANDQGLAKATDYFPLLRFLGEKVVGNAQRHLAAFRCNSSMTE